MINGYIPSCHVRSGYSLIMVYHVFLVIAQSLTKYMRLFEKGFSPVVLNSLHRPRRRPRSSISPSASFGPTMAMVQGVHVKRPHTLFYSCVFILSPFHLDHGSHHLARSRFKSAFPLRKCDRTGEEWQSVPLYR